jgi:hypothetical protein
LCDNWSKRMTKKWNGLNNKQPESGFTPNGAGGNKVLEAEPMRAGGYGKQNGGKIAGEAGYLNKVK